MELHLRWVEVALESLEEVESELHLEGVELDSLEGVE